MNAVWIHPQENKAFWFIMDTLQKKGFKAYIAGGAVRDMLLHRKPDDLDILTNASIPEVAHLFQGQKVKIMGKAFPICCVNGIEISSGRAGSDPDNFPESDLAQRDFTINSMAWDPLTHKLIDPFNGRKDLEDAVIRFTKDPEQRIAEDPVRMVRACRFAALINGSFSVSSYTLMTACRDLLSTSVAKERIHKEIIKAMGLKTPSLFFMALKKTGLLSKIFPSLDRCHDLDGGPHHGETVFEHCMMVGDALSKNRPILRLAGFLHDVGKFDTARPGNDGLTFPGHENETQALVQDLESLRFPHKDIAYIAALAHIHMRPLTDQTSPRAVRRLLAKLADTHLDFQDFMRLRIADKKGNRLKKPYTLSEIRIRLKKLFAQMACEKAFHINHLKISGDDIMQILGIEPGPDVGRIKQQLFEMVLDEPGKNNYMDLRDLCHCLQIKK